MHREDLHRRLSRAHREGVQAHREGLGENDNPYGRERFDQDILEASFWNQGWREGARRSARRES